MIPEHMEPIGLAPDCEPWSDNYFASRRKDAVRGSNRLCYALLKFQRRHIPRRLRPSTGRPRTMEARLTARSQTKRIRLLVAVHYGITIDELTGIRGKATLAKQRHVAMYLARELTTASFKDIGVCFGNRDHSTVFHACRLIENDPTVNADLDTLRARFMR